MTMLNDWDEQPANITDDPDGVFADETCQNCGIAIGQHPNVPFVAFWFTPDERCFCETCWQDFHDQAANLENVLQREQMRWTIKRELSQLCDHIKLGAAYPIEMEAYERRAEFLSWAAHQRGVPEADIEALTAATFGVRPLSMLHSEAASLGWEQELSDSFPD